MKSKSPKQIARLTALANASALALIYFLLEFWLFRQFNWVGLVLVIVSAFVVSYYLILYSMEYFINQKIKLIYKTIHKEKTRSKTAAEKLDLDTNILENVNREVIQWAQENRQEIADLKKQAEFRSEFIGNLSHELKTPIFNIQGYLLTLLEGGLEDTRINADYLRKADQNLERVIALINDLELITRLESDENYLQFGKFDIVALAEEVLVDAEPKALERGIKLTFNMKYDNPIMVFADKAKIYQVLSNLVNNSIYYGKKNGTTKIRFYDMDENLLVEVTDDGIGIDKVHLPRLFERFYRVDKSRARHQGGTGLGLAIVKHIIESHDQSINVRSTLGEGSAFSFTLKKLKTSKAVKAAKALQL
jgi:two-component system phosphate regulon sensor histidine kinase PhoR